MPTRPKAPHTVEDVNDKHITRLCPFHRNRTAEVMDLRQVHIPNVVADCAVTSVTPDIDEDNAAVQSLFPI